MAKIGFKRLTRGVALLTDHIHAQIQKAATRLTTTGVDSSNLEAGWGTFRMNLSLPSTNSTGFTAAVVPFTLPPLQEFFTTIPGVSNPSTPLLVLEEASFSFDQRSEPAAIADGLGGSIEGNIYYDGAEKLDVRLVIFEKDMEAWKTGTLFTKQEFTREVYSLTIPAIALSGEFTRLNPVAQSGLDIVFDPYKTYKMRLEFPKLADMIIPSATVSLKFRSPLVPRLDNTGAFRSQHLPLAYNGARQTTPLVIPVPAAGALVESDVADGVETVMESVDDVIRGRLVGGYSDVSAPLVGEEILDDSAYEVIAVPMWGNGWAIEGGTAEWAALPYMAAGDTSPTIDRRIIPLHQPVEVHHVIAAANYTRNLADADDQTQAGRGYRPVSPTFAQSVSVGIGSAIRSDQNTVRQLALATWDPAGVASFRIDEVGENAEFGDLWDIMNIPLVGDGADLGTGYSASTIPGSALSNTGKPVFAGKSDSPLAARSNFADLPPSLGGTYAAGAALPNVKDQFLEVRWRIQDVGGLGNPITWANNEMVIGKGGHWVFIICKKYLC